MRKHIVTRFESRINPHNLYTKERSLMHLPKTAQALFTIVQNSKKRS
jgi:hypothetical protein